MSGSYKVLSKFYGPNGRQYRVPIYLGCFHFAALANELAAMTITVKIKCCILINKTLMRLDESKQATEEKKTCHTMEPLDANLYHDVITTSVTSTSRYLDL